MPAAEGGGAAQRPRMMQEMAGPRASGTRRGAPAVLGAPAAMPDASQRPVRPAADVVGAPAAVRASLGRRNAHRAEAGARLR